jgi:hypothetical protein
MATGYPMVGWGIAWILGLGALDLLDGTTRIVVTALAWLIGMLLSWLPLRTAIRTGSETRMRGAWVIVLVASPFLVAAAHPADFSHGVLLATEDQILTVTSGIGIVMAGLLAELDAPNRLLWFGISAGLPLLALGILRVVRGRSHL